MCAQSGLLPNDVLDLNFGQVQAVIDGYSDRVADNTCYAVWAGYYSAYYSNAKHPKSPGTIIRSILNEAAPKHGATSAKINDIQSEIDNFAQREAAFLKRKEAMKHG